MTYRSIRPFINLLPRLFNHLAGLATNYICFSFAEGLHISIIFLLLFYFFKLFVLHMYLSKSTGKRVFRKTGKRIKIKLISIEAYTIKKE